MSSEITVEVILCKYSRQLLVQMGGADRRAGVQHNVSVSPRKFSFGAHLGEALHCYPKKGVLPLAKCEASATREGP